MAFGLYIGGLALLSAGLIYAAIILHVSPQWIAAGALVVLGLGVLSGVKATKERDSS